MLPKHWLLPMVLSVALPVLAAPPPAPLDSYLREGKIQEGLAAYAAPANNAERFSLGMLQALEGMRKFGTGMSELGADPRTLRGQMTGSARELPPGVGAVTATPAKVAQLFQDFRTSLLAANATLSKIDDQPFMVEVNLSQAYVDLNGDGQCTPNESLISIFQQSFPFPVNRPPRGQPPPEDLVVRFDSADAAWLKGYTHLLLGTLDLVMAYDWRPVWDQCAHLVFFKPDPMPAIALHSSPPQMRFSQWADLIAAVHCLHLDLVDKDGPRRARDHVKAAAACSRLCWQRVQAETDDDHEWLPSPRQTGPRGAKISQEQIDGWMHVVDEVEAIADGKKLLPHWRIVDGTGINVDKLVANPPKLDLVLMIQGSALVPYLEKGEVSDQRRWNELTRIYGGNFFRFALWSN